jgi:hypothetical protein
VKCAISAPWADVRSIGFAEFESGPFPQPGLAAIAAVNGRSILDAKGRNAAARARVVAAVPPAPDGL